MYIPKDISHYVEQAIMNGYIELNAHPLYYALWIVGMCIVIPVLCLNYVTMEKTQEKQRLAVVVLWAVLTLLFVVYCVIAKIAMGIIKFIGSVFVSIGSFGKIPRVVRGRINAYCVFLDKVYSKITFGFRFDGNAEEQVKRFVN